MYSPAFIDEVYKKAQDDATKLVRDYQGRLEKIFEVRTAPASDPRPMLMNTIVGQDGL